MSGTDVYQATQTIDTDNAREFLNELSVHHERFRKGAKPWLFRGHDDDSYSLKPTIFRDDDRTKKYIEHLVLQR